MGSHFGLEIGKVGKRRTLTKALTGAASTRRTSLFSANRGVAVIDQRKTHNENLLIVLTNPWSICNKAEDINDFIIEYNIDILAITETWLTGTACDGPTINALLPNGYEIIHAPRRTRGGGTALVYRQSLNVTHVAVSSASFEVLECVTKGPIMLRVCVVYQPYRTALFMEEFSSYLAGLATSPGRLLVLGDFNLYVDDPLDKTARSRTAFNAGRDLALTTVPQREVKGKGRRIPRDMLPLNPGMAERFASLTKDKREQDDPEVVQFIRDAIIEDRRPFLPKMSYNLYRTPQAAEVEKILKKKKKGFFVEAGGLDGERSSNTIWFEKKHGWTGFLIEMDPSYYLQLRGKNRHCYTANACISSTNFPAMVPFIEMRGGNAAISSKVSKNSLNTMCFPFYSMMLALNRTKIDYFSLDVEGQELAVLKTISFDKLDISVLSVEYLHTNKNKLKQFMKSKGYKLVKTLAYGNAALSQWSYDYIFVKNETIL
ncbi:hypothetical protein CAPTEDRAFT_197327 [Capitella teleta]|uniref:Endonuclease/exonuclease/phosphatase domain-containing protein n=1 Tax=Capitella teleta TaxID=283909 RepID=R7TP23_CAPTE|nr:hypothetical protein CAPTEDRAFT_197327 [Capitella teleta]|eukprot:ELT95653.1 hypothetical protein CAPTEDRAFT_197327 [Capitella teleta]